MTVAAVALQFVLALGVIWQFQLESRTFFYVMATLGAGFVVHALLPLRFRLPFFAILSLVTVIVGFGWRDGGFLIALGLTLIGVCHLPVRLGLRVVILLLVGGLFALWRVEWLPAPWSITIWPILGSMFMFRLAVYLYTITYTGERPAPARTLAYFFMAPNVCFPLFPVVDYTTFVRSHYDRDAARIYETGMRWIARGLLHLILYRFVNQYLTVDPAQLVNLGQLLQFVVATYLLYLRVSGQFHLISGVLHLFGFRLPETHHLYYLASSFTDFWRRINIYWKDFMQKLVYYPSFFRLRRRGTVPAMISATVVVFAGTWILHSYQWFWLRGGFPLAATDGLFWGILCLLVIFGSLREMKRPPKRTLDTTRHWSLALGLRTVGLFCAVAVLWSLWSADAVLDWLTMWIVATNVTAGSLVLIVGLLALGVVVAGWPWSVRETDRDVAQPFYRRGVVQSTAVLVGILVASMTNLYASVSPATASMVASLQRSRLSARDAALQHRGYYEHLDNPSRMSVQLWELQAKQPKHWALLNTTPAYRKRDDFPRGELRPGVQIIHKDRRLAINEWGMRDRIRSKEKPPGTYRIAFLGPSIIMGEGLDDNETLPAMLEERLNASAPARQRYEVLNFGIAACSLVEQLALLEERVLAFSPDVIFFADSPRLRRPIVLQILHAFQKGAAVPYPELEAMIRQTGVYASSSGGRVVPFHPVRAALGKVGIRTRMPRIEAHRRLRLIADDMVQWTFKKLADVSRAHGAVPVFVLLDNVVDPPREDVPAARQAALAGLVLFNVLDLWQNLDKPALRLAEWDNHPNAAGNRLLAARLAALVHEHRSALRLDARPEQMAERR